MQGDGQDPVGARLTLAFKDHVPELTGAEVKALLAPLISFDVKTPVQAFTDTLPTKLKEAILNHHVLVGMSTDMVLFAKGQPEGKSREMDGQMPFEEWIYGKPPQDVEFVRINGNRVIRVEVGQDGRDPGDLHQGRGGGADAHRRHAARARRRREHARCQSGRRGARPDTQAPAAPPSLRKPGEKLPSRRPGRRRGDEASAVPQAEAGRAAGRQSGRAGAQPPAGVQPVAADASQPSPAGRSQASSAGAG